MILNKIGCRIASFVMGAIQKIRRASNFLKSFAKNKTGVKEIRMSSKTKGRKQPQGGGLKQPVEAVGWSKKAFVKVHKEVSGGVKLFWPEIDNGDGSGCGYRASREGLKVSSRSKALSHAMDYCNAHKMRIMSVQGVREDKYTLW